jgi:hypothetical protein
MRLVRAGDTVRLITVRRLVDLTARMERCAARRAAPLEA